MRNRKGLTLVELLIIIAIVGLLVAAAIPMVQQKINPRDDSWKTTGIARYNGITVKVESYNPHRGEVSIKDLANPNAPALVVSTGSLDR